MWILNVLNSPDSLSHWRLGLSEFDFDNTCWAGIKYHITSAPALPKDGTDRTLLVEDLLPLAIRSIDDSGRAVHFINFLGEENVLLSVIKNDFATLQKARDSPTEATLEEFIREQSCDTYCHFAAMQVCHQNSAHYLDCYGLLSRRTTVDDALEAKVLPSLRHHTFTFSRHTIILGEPGQRQMYYTPRRQFFMGEHRKWC